MEMHSSICSFKICSYVSACTCRIKYKCKRLPVLSFKQDEDLTFVPKMSLS